MILIIRFLPVLLLVFLVIRIYQFIKMNIDHKRNMRKIKEFDTFNSQLLKWVEQIEDSSIKEKVLLHSLEILKSGTIEKFDRGKELEIIREKFGKWIPDLVQKHRQEQIEKLI